MNLKNGPHKSTFLQTKHWFTKTLFWELKNILFYFLFSKLATQERYNKLGENIVNFQELKAKIK